MNRPSSHTAAVATLSRRAACRRGFTLVEMLVVLLVMGLLAGTVRSIVQPDERTLLRVEVERLVQLMDLAAAQARLTGTSIAWTADGPGYRFWQFSEDLGWSRIVDDQQLRARTLPQGMMLSNLRIENARPPERMRVEFGSARAAPGFSVDMSLGASRYTMANSPVGDFTMAPGVRGASHEAPQ